MSTTLFQLFNKLRCTAITNYDSDRVIFLFLLELRRYTRIFFEIHEKVLSIVYAIQKC